MTEELEKKAEQFAEEHAFRVPYDGSNKFYDDTDYKASKDGYIAGVTEVTKELEAQIEKMKCCENCNHKNLNWSFSPICKARDEIEIENPLTCKCDKWEIKEE